MPKKIPIRQCLGCREAKPKKELVRVVRAPEGGVSIDFKGKAPGRGAYVCPNAQCLKRALKSNAIARSLDTPLPQELTDALLRQLEEGQDGAE